MQVSKEKFGEKRGLTRSTRRPFSLDGPGVGLGDLALPLPFPLGSDLGVATFLTSVCFDFDPDAAFEEDLAWAEAFAFFSSLSTGVI
jgi:hypothetical protein